MGTRHFSRTLALQILYQCDLQKEFQQQLFPRFWKMVEEYRELLNINLKELEQAQAFATVLAQGVCLNKEELDLLIEEHSQHWKISRMPPIDRNVLRLAVFELLHCPEIPPHVSLNEAIELGKQFGSEHSSAFVNGILDRIAQIAQNRRNET